MRTGKDMKRNGNGDGSWRTLKSGSIHWDKWYTAKSGARKKLGVTGKDKTECRKLMKEAEEKFELTSRMEFSNDGCLEECMEFWLTSVKKKDPKCGDTAYTRLLSTFETHIKSSYLGKTQEDQIKDKDILLFLSELKKHSSAGKVLETPLSFSSKKKVYDLLNMYFSHKYIRASELNPMLTVPAPVKETRYAKSEGAAWVEDDDDEDDGKIVPLSSVWNDEEMLEIHNYCMKPYAPGKRGSVKRGPLLSFLMWTFMRAGELRALTWQDIHLEEGNEYVSITKTYKKRGQKGNYDWYIGKPKSKRSIRNIQLLPEAIEAIKEYKRRFPPVKESDFVMLGDTGEILCAKNLNNYLSSVLRGLDYNQLPCKNKKVHGLRHTGISYLIRKQVPREVVSTLAGHSSTTITEQVYTEIIAEYCKNEIIKIGTLKL